MESHVVKRANLSIAANNGPRKLGTLLMPMLVSAALLVIATSRLTCAAPAAAGTASEEQVALQQQANIEPPTSAVAATAAAVAPSASRLLRFRRHASATKQLLEGDEQVLRRQLPDLIAQAHQDKTVERALLKMLINASLRSGLGNMVANSAASANSGAGNNWQLDNDNTLTQYSQVGDSFVPIRSARMEQAPSGFSGASELAQLDTSDLSSLQASIAQLNGRLQPLLEQQRELQQQQQQLQPQMDKREYIKPCSFNAISCVRRPFQVNK